MTKSKLGKEFRMFGPPGTGKTTRLAETSIPKAVESFGKDGVVVTSFTKASAKEIAGRGLSVNEDNVGTLHALCYRILGYPKLMTNHIDEWNAKYPQLRITGKNVSSLDAGGIDSDGTYPGDDLLGELNIKRNKMTDSTRWLENIKAFEMKWKMFKYSNNLLDFTDLIEKVLEDKIPPPNNAQMMFVDEAQDLTPMQLALVRQWGTQMDRYMLVGDDDQTIYSFTGASPEAFLTPAIPQSQKMVLRQSYRVPKAILERSMQLIKQVKVREPKKYKPRVDIKTGKTVIGKVRSLPEGWKNPDAIIEDVEAMVQTKKSCMILTSCTYMLDGIRNRLKERIIPFGNKYRTTRADWNPLASGYGKRLMPRDLLYSFLDTGIDEDYWNIPGFLKWATNIRVGQDGLRYKQGKKVLRKLKEMVKNNEKGLHSCREVLGMVLTENAVERALVRDVGWFQNMIMPKRQKAIDFPIKIYNKYKTLKIFDKDPLLTIGSIHSVKGGEAEIVYLYPDISMAAERDRQHCINTSAEDSLRRLFYVGMTRAKEELVLMAPATRRKKTGNRPVMYVEL